VKNITLSAEDHVIEKARLIARSRHSTLNAEFRRWLLQYTAETTTARQYDDLMRRLKHVRAGRKYSRDEMNER
jgi:hypothetical protein